MKTVRADCRTCKTVYLLHVDDETGEGLVAQLSRATQFECLLGKHVEPGPPIEHLCIDWSTLTGHLGSASDVMFGWQLILEYGRANVYVVGDKTMGGVLGIPDWNELKAQESAGFGNLVTAGHEFVRRVGPRGLTVFYVRKPRV